MTKLTDIPVVVVSGQKYLTKHGVVAIKDGVKAQHTQPERLPKPKWLRVVNQISPKYLQIKEQVQQHGLATVCEEAKCPNIAECWSHGTATIMLLGSVCTRACRFCAVDTGNPHGRIDPAEIAEAARTVAYMNLDYVVLTSVNRDDLADGGAAHYAATIRAIKQQNPNIKVELPEINGGAKSIPVIVFQDGTHLTEPSDIALTEKLKSLSII